MPMPVDTENFLYFIRKILHEMFENMLSNLMSPYRATEFVLLTIGNDSSDS